MRSVGALILAAGGSSRLGQPKQFLPWDGESLIRRVVRAATEAGCSRILVVAGEAREPIETELKQTAVEVVANPDWQQGLGTSIRAGLKYLLAAREPSEAVVLLACDQPFVDAAVIRALIAQWEVSRKPIVACRYAGTLGIPTLFAEALFKELAQLPDDSGAKPIISSRANDEIAEVPFEAAAIDIDTAADYESARTSR